MMQGPKIALFEPDIPQNTAAIIRTCACLGCKIRDYRAMWFFISDKRFKRVVMDYMDEKEINFTKVQNIFLNQKKIKELY